MPRKSRFSLQLAFSLLLASFFFLPFSRAQNLQAVDPIYNVQLSNVHLIQPAGLAVDVHDALYLVDTGQAQVWKVDVFGETTLVAGTGASGYTGDNGLAIEATLKAPTAVCTDAVGNIYIADSGNYAVRRIDANTGIITTFAGGNGSGNSGDGGLATAAKFEDPDGLVYDSMRSVLYIADGQQGLVHAVSAAGILTVFAGSASPTSPGNGDGGSPTAATLLSPHGLALDVGGNLYIAETGAGDVRVVNVAGMVIVTSTGTGTKGNSGIPGASNKAQLTSPTGVAVDTAGDIFIADSATGLITEVDTSSTISAVGGRALAFSVGDGEPALIAQILQPAGLAIDSAGGLFVDSATAGAAYKIMTRPLIFPSTPVGSSSAEQRVILMNFGTTLIHLSSEVTTGDFAIAPSQMPTNARPCNNSSYEVLQGTGAPLNNFCTLDLLFTPTAPGPRNGSLKITSDDTPSTLQVSAFSSAVSPMMAVSDGVIYTIAGTYPTNLLSRLDGIPATTANLGTMGGFSFDPSGNLFLAEYGLCDVRKVSATTGLISTVAGTLSDNCGYSGNGGSATTALFDGVQAATVRPDGSLYISDALNGVIREVDSGGIVHSYAGIFLSPHVCDQAMDGSQAALISICPATSITFDSNGNLFFAEPLVNAIRKITPAGIISTVAGVFNAPNGYSGDNGPATAANLNQPSSIAFDSANNLYFSDTGNQIIRRIDAVSGVITTVAGTPKTYGYTGDGGLATSATLYSPHGVALDAAGDLYIADSANQLIRKVDAASKIISTIGGSYILGNGYNGDGLPATSTAINYPLDLHLDPQGDVVFNDNDDLVRKISPDGLVDFGGQLINTSSPTHTLTISNIGNTSMTFEATPYFIDGDFSVATGGTCDLTQPLAPGASCTVLIQFKPSTTNERYGTLSFYDNGIASPQITELRGYGNPAGGTLTLSPPSYTFPDTVIGSSSGPQTFTVANNSSSIVHITNVAESGDYTDYATSQSCIVTLNANASCPITVTFVPLQVGTYVMTVNLTDDATGSPQSFTITGKGIAATPAVTLTPSPLNFSAQNVGATTTLPVTLTNTGNGALNLVSTAISGTGASAYSIVTGTNACGSTLAPSANCNIYIRFAPSTVGAYPALLVVTDNASGSPQNVPINGQATAFPDFTLTATPATATFAAGSTSTVNIALSSVLSGNPFSGVVQFAASGVPSDWIATFTPSTVTPDSAGNGATVLTITAPHNLGPEAHRSSTLAGFLPLAVLLLGIAGSRRRRSVSLLCLVLVGSSILLLGMTGCGAGGFAEPRTSVTATITVTATSGSTQHSTQVVLTAKEE